MIPPERILPKMAKAKSASRKRGSPGADRPESRAPVRAANKASRRRYEYDHHYGLELHAQTASKASLGNAPAAGTTPRARKPPRAKRAQRDR